MIGEWKILYIEVCDTLCRSPDIISGIKSRRLRWASHVTRKEGDRSALEVLKSKPTINRVL